MESSRLEELERGLHQALRLLERDEGRATSALPADHPAVRAAEACELMLPETLTAAALAEAIRHKIDVVQVLLARSRAHESLPEDARLAADEGYLTATDGVPKDAPELR
ncbi:hypothetical protein IP92_01345 [Pseudoduganella flava]|uniref:DUF222 domain-containing protein n=1 Tax=Pseudoduganella flava TaxID=871742 RepID=A0A562Q1C2_9BURK|nr:hypothetical protein [Pseudoduganella flava]QGZ38344.1 hypothetical protein GO485_04270 [Pseudoduganella flava]TWI50116.1 hypothetical protein IP92_01345 [Pseudoduganella flava]